MSRKTLKNDWPIYFRERLTVSNLNSNIAIVTLWTPKEVIEKLINPNLYCVIGQLYTKKGINYVLRNIFAHPSINKIYLAGNDLMDSGRAFNNLCKNGINGDHQIIGDKTALIEKEISSSAIKDFRRNVEMIDRSGTENLKKISAEIHKEKITRKAEFWRKPEVFPDPPKSQVSRLPAEVDLIKIRRPTIAEAYLAVLKHINNFGCESEAMIGYVSATSKKLKEILNLSVVITDEDASNWYLPNSFPFSKRDLQKYFDGFFDYDRHTEDYTYGERLFNYASDEINMLKKIYPWLKIGRFQRFFPHGGYDQVAISIIRKLKKFPYDKGAIAILSNPFRDVFPQRPPRKTPCLVLIQCQVYANRLYLTAYFRSNDMYNAWPLNAFALRKIQFTISQELGIPVGHLVTISNMAHIYEHNWKDSEALVRKYYKGNCEWDPRGNFHVSTVGKSIKVKLVSPDGNQVLKQWKADGMGYKVASKLMFQIIEEDLAVSVLGNAADLAIQIERAETAIKLGLKYRQDNPLDLTSLIKT